MNRLIVLGLLAAVGCASETLPTPGEGTPLDRVQTEVIEVEGWSEDDVLLYSYGMLMPGQTVGPAFDIDGEEEEPFIVTEPTWFFWADLSPYQYFGHPTAFIYVDDEGGPVRVERQNWFPVIDGLVFHPPDPVWGVPDAGPDTGTSTMALRTMAGQPCGRPQAVILQGWDHRFIDNTVARLAATLAARGYDIHRVTPAEEPDPGRRKNAFIRKMRELEMGERVSQIDIFYLGHGNQNGRWVFGSHEQGVSTMPAGELAFILGAPATNKLNIIIDSCYSGRFVNPSFEPFDKSVSDAGEADHVEISVVASSLAGQRSNLSRTRGHSAFTERLIDSLQTQTGNQPFDYGGPALPGFTVETRNAMGVDITAQQDPAPPTSFGPLMPVLTVDSAYDQCQVVANVGTDDYNRRVVIRGAAFGDTQGTVEIFAWSELAEAGIVPWTAFSMPITGWSDSVIEVRVPMRSEGFPADPSLLVGQLEGYAWDTTDPAAYYVGNYFVQVTRADGVKSASFEIAPDAGEVPPQHFFAPQLLHISPQIQTSDWTPEYSEEDYVDFNEMWHPMTAASEGLGTATVLVSDLRLSTEPLPVLLDDGGVPMPISLRRMYEIFVSRPHSTGPVASSIPDGWTYDLPAAERDLATAQDQRQPLVNFYGFRQRMDPDWDFRGTWKYLLIYD